MIGKIPRYIGAIVVAIAMFAAISATASAATIYNNLPKPKPGNVVSIGFEATSTSEFGGQVEFGGKLRNDPKVTVMMSSWACQEGSGVTCKTVAGATFMQPLTLNIYEVGPENTPGALLGSVTQTFNVPYRPSANKNCMGEQAGEFSHGGTCFNGKATDVTFEPVGITVPSKAILSIAYSTSDHGAAPKRPQACNAFNPSRCPYDSLNVGVTEPANEAAPEPVDPSVGADPLPAYTYANSTYDAMYGAEPHGAIGTFSLANEWTGYQPLFKVSASK